MNNLMSASIAHEVSQANLMKDENSLNSGAITVINKDENVSPEMLSCKLCDLLLRVINTNKIQLDDGGYFKTNIRCDLEMIETVCGNAEFWAKEVISKLEDLGYLADFYLDDNGLHFDVYW